MSVLEVRRLALPAALATAFIVFPVVSAQVAPPRDPAAYAPADDRDWTDQIPAHLWAVEGIVSIERDGRADAAEENLALLAGDVLRTERGRAEVLFEDGSALDIDEFSRVDLLSESLVRLTEGRIRLTLARGADTFDYRVDTAAGSAVMRTAGDYRLALSARRGAPELQLTVLRGQADLVNSFGRTALRTGTESVAIDGRAPSAAYGINSALGDSFDRWVDTMRAERLGTTSTQYLPADLRAYGGAFDQYGSWDYLPNHGGHVWYPRVSMGWRPYSVGRWSVFANFGWFWVGADRWSWPTHHYGRWGLSANRWYWVPDRRWAPAWVAWGGAPGYTSWCPLGFDGRPVVAFSGVRYADPWSAWTVVPTRVFANNIVVSRHAVNSRGIAPNVRSQFEVRRAPVGGAYSPQRVQPLRAPTMGRAASRDGVRAGALREVDRTVTGAGGRSRAGDFVASPTSRSIDAPRDRAVAPSIDPGAARTRSRMPARDAAGRLTSPSLEAPPRPDPPRLEAPPLSTPSSWRAQPRSRAIDDGRSPAPASGLPSTRSYRSQEPPPASSDVRPSRTYRSRDGGGVPLVSVPDRGSSVPSRPAERSVAPSDRGSSDTPAVRSRPSGGDSPRAEPPGRSRVESRPPSSDGARSAPPSRAGGQAVRRGGGV